MKARLPQGFGGGMGNLQQLARQAQKIQEEMDKTSAELELQEYLSLIHIYRTVCRQPRQAFQ